MANAQRAFETANPAMLAAIVETAKTRTIVADQDICDDRGTKLWARGQPVSASLQQRLLERKLRQPLEACLRAEDGVTNVHLIEHLATLPADAAIVQLTAEERPAVEKELRSVPLHAAVQLLLTAAQTARPTVFDHAVRGMLLAGAMAVSAGMSREAVRLAMLGGLLHDLGEMYIDPQYLDPRQALTPLCYRHVVSHPLVGRQLVEQLTDYPAALAVAVGEHHERLDGSGYPARRDGAQLSPLGRLLAVVELTLGMAGGAQGDTLRRIGLALRMVPGEFDAAWTGFVTRAVAPQPTTADTVSEADRSALRDHWALLDRAAEIATPLASESVRSPIARRIATRVLERLTRLRVGLHAIGLWPQALDSDAFDAFETQAAVRELRYRLRSVWRECAWSEGELGEADQATLAPLCSLLQGEEAGRA